MISCPSKNASIWQRREPILSHRLPFQRLVVRRPTAVTIDPSEIINPADFTLQSLVARGITIRKFCFSNSLAQRLVWSFFAKSNGHDHAWKSQQIRHQAGDDHSIESCTVWWRRDVGRWRRPRRRSWEPSILSISLIGRVVAIPQDLVPGPLIDPHVSWPDYFEQVRRALVRFTRLGLYHLKNNYRNFLLCREKRHGVLYRDPDTEYDAWLLVTDNK